MIAIPYQKWSDIDPSLPDVEIEVLGPPPTSGTREAFVELAMEGVSKSFAGIKVAAARQALEIPPERCREHALTYSWRHTAERFVSYLAPWS